MTQINEQITVPVWVCLDKETRSIIATVFNLNKSGSSEVVNMPTYSRVVSDGHTNEDLAKITVEALQSQLGTSSETDTVFSLFNQLVDKVEGIKEDTEAQIVQEIVENEVIEPISEPVEEVIEPVVEEVAETPVGGAVAKSKSKKKSK